MTNYTCAVADCKSDSRKKVVKKKDIPYVKGYVKFPSATKEPERRKLWEARCRRGEGWKATKNHVICSLHFIGWLGKKPSPHNPDPVIFEYNGWGKVRLVNIFRNTNILQCQRQETRNARRPIRRHRPIIRVHKPRALEVFVFDKTHYGPEVEIDNNPVVITKVTGN